MRSDRVIVVFLFKIPIWQTHEAIKTNKQTHACKISRKKVKFRKDYIPL